MQILIVAAWAGKTSYDAKISAREIDERYVFDRTLYDSRGLVSGWRFIIINEAMKKEVQRGLIIEAIRRLSGTGNIVTTYRGIVASGNDAEIDGVIRELSEQIHQVPQGAERETYMRRELLGDRLYELIKTYPI